MTVGLPGAGIGGLLYLTGALLAPARELARTVTDDPRPRQWPLVLRQFAIAVSILGGMAATGWVIAVLAQSPAVTSVVGEPAIGREYPAALAKNLGTFTLGTLLAVLAAVEALRLVVLSPERTQRVAMLALVVSGMATESAGQTAEQAPVVEFGGVASGETGAGMFGGSVGADFAAGETGRVGFTYQQRRVSALGDAMQSQRIGARFHARPRRDLRIAATGGVWSPGVGTLGTGTRPEATFRLRKVPSARGGIIDLRAHHRMLDVTPELVMMPVRHSQISTAVDLPLAGPWSLRGQGRLAALSRSTDVNRRVGFGGGLGLTVSPSVKVSGQWHHVRHSNPFVTGYFAPRAAESLEAGIEVEREFERTTLSLDLGAGVQRVQRASAVTGPWAPAFRGWGMVAWQLVPRHQLLLEFEAYDSRIASAVSTAEQWRYAAMTASMRIALAR